MKKKTEQLNSAEIEKNLATLSEKLRTIRFGAVGAASKNVKEQGNLRREIARLLTMKNALGAQK